MNLNNSTIIFLLFFFLSTIFLFMGCHVPMPQYEGMTPFVELKGKIAVAPLDTDPQYAEYGEFFSETLFTFLAKARKLDLVERRLIKKVIDEELKLSIDTDLFDQNTAAQLGKFAGARYIFVGTLKKHPSDEKMFSINIRLIEVETAEVISGCSWSENSHEEDITETSRKLAQSILYQFFPEMRPRLITPASAACASTLAPGSGQLINERKSGYLFLSTGLLAAGGIAATQYNLVDAQNQLNSANQLSVYRQLQKKVEEKREQRNIALGIYGGMLVINIIDAYFESRSAVETYRRSFEQEMSSRSGDVQIIFITMQF